MNVYGRIDQLNELEGEIEKLTSQVVDVMLAMKDACQAVDEMEFVDEVSKKNIKLILQGNYNDQLEEIYRKIDDNRDVVAELRQSISWTAWEESLWGL